MPKGMLHEVGTDETGTTCDEKCSHDKTTAEHTGHAEQDFLGGLGDLRG